MLVFQIWLGKNRWNADPKSAQINQFLHGRFKFQVASRTIIDEAMLQISLELNSKASRQSGITQEVYNIIPCKPILESFRSPPKDPFFPPSISLGPAPIPTQNVTHGVLARITFSYLR